MSGLLGSASVFPAWADTFYNPDIENGFSSGDWLIARFLSGQGVSWLLLLIGTILVGYLLYVILPQGRSRGDGGTGRRGGRESSTALGSAMQEVVWTTDMHLTVNYCSPSLMRLLGHPPNLIIGQPLAMALGSMSASAAVSDSLLWSIYSRMSNLSAAGSRRQDIDAAEPMMISLRHADGRLIPVEVSLWLHTIETGKLAEIRVVMRAVSEIDQRQTADAVMARIRDEGKLATKADFYRRGGLYLSAVAESGEHAALIVIASDTWDVARQRWGETYAEQLMEMLYENVIGKVPDPCFVARLDVQRVVVFCPHTSLAEAASLAETIRIAIAVAPLMLEGGQHVNCTASLGISTSGGREGLSSVMVRAEGALRQAVHSGGNTVCLSVGGSDASMDQPDPDGAVTGTDAEDDSGGDPQADQTRYRRA